MPSLREGIKGPKRDIVLLNAGAALYIGGLAKTVEAGVKLAAETIDSGSAYEKLKELVKGSDRGMQHSA